LARSKAIAERREKR